MPSTRAFFLLKMPTKLGPSPNIVKTSRSLIDRSSLVAGAAGLAPVALLVGLLALRPVDVGVGPASHVSILYNKRLSLPSLKLDLLLDIRMSNVVSSLNLYINTSCGSWNDTGLSPPAHGPSWDSLKNIL